MSPVIIPMTHWIILIRITTKRFWNFAFFARPRKKLIVRAIAKMRAPKTTDPNDKVIDRTKELTVGIIPLVPLEKYQVEIDPAMVTWEIPEIVAVIQKKKQTLDNTSNF